MFVTSASRRGFFHRRATRWQRPLAAPRAQRAPVPTHFGAARHGVCVCWGRAGPSGGGAVCWVGSLAPVGSCRLAGRGSRRDGPPPAGAPRDGGGGRYLHEVRVPLELPPREVRRREGEGGGFIRGEGHQNSRKG